MKQKKTGLFRWGLLILGLFFALPSTELQPGCDEDDLESAWVDLVAVEQVALYQWVQDLEIEWVTSEPDDEIVKKLSSLPARTKMKVLQILIEKNSYFLFRVLFYHLLLCSKSCPRKQAITIEQIRNLILKHYKSDELYAHYTVVMTEYYKRNL